jgi:hypothetical protein
MTGDDRTPDCAAYRRRSRSRQHSAQGRASECFQAVGHHGHAEKEKADSTKDGDYCCQDASSEWTLPYQRVCCPQPPRISRRLWLWYISDASDNVTDSAEAAHLPKGLFTLVAHGQAANQCWTSDYGGDRVLRHRRRGCTCRTASETSKPWEEAVSAARAQRDHLPALSGHLRSLRLAGARRGKSEGSGSGVRPNAGHGSGDAAVCR